MTSLQGPAVEGLNESTKRHKSFGKAHICTVGTKTLTRTKVLNSLDQYAEEISPASFPIVNHDATAASCEAKSNRRWAENC